MGLNLTRATLDACTKYPWTALRGRRAARRARRRHSAGRGEVRRLRRRPAGLRLAARRGVDGTRQCLEAQVMDLADDVAYSVHDVEDGIVAGRLDLTRPRPRRALGDGPRRGTCPASTTRALDAALGDLRAVGSWPQPPYDGSRRSLAAIKNLTSDLIGRFCGSAQQATLAASGGEPPVRHRADLVVPGTHRGGDRGAQGHRRPLRHAGRRPGDADGAPARAGRRARRGAVGPRRRRARPGRSWRTGTRRPTTPGRRRVVIDQVASLTDASAVTRHALLTR